MGTQYELRVEWITATLRLRAIFSADNCGFGLARSFYLPKVLGEAIRGAANL